MPPALDELAADARQTCWVCSRSGSLPFFCCCFCLVGHFHFTSSHQLYSRSPQLPVAFMIYFAFVLHRAILAADDAPADPAAGSVCLVWSSSLVFFPPFVLFLHLESPLPPLPSQPVLSWWAIISPLLSSIVLMFARLRLVLLYSPSAAHVHESECWSHRQFLLAALFALAREFHSV